MKYSSVINIEEYIEKILPEVVEWRHYFHKHPELAFQEHETSKFIQTKLEEFGIPCESGWAVTGVIGRIEVPGAKKKIAMRAEMDALPIHEENSHSYRSIYRDRMHACGHDGHMAGLLGAAKVIKELHERKILRNSIYFIFQPAEENEGGAKRMFEENFKEKYDFDEVYAIHNWPELPEGIFATKKGPIMASYDSFDIYIKGKGTHAAMPHNGIDVIYIATMLIQNVYAYISRINPLEEKVISFTSIQAGTTYNVLPDEVHIRGTLRTLQENTRNTVLNYLKNLLQNWKAIYGYDFHLNLKEGYPATINTPEEVEKVKRIVENRFGKDYFYDLPKPSMGSEDFSYFIQNYKGAYIFLGSGRNGELNAGLHNPKYDFHDGILKNIIRFWVELALWEE